MPITKHRIDEKGRVIYEITTVTPDGVLVEKHSADQLLVYDPESVELYQYFYGDGPGLALQKTRNSKGHIQTKLEAMIIHYVEEEHYNAALDIIRGIISARRKPSRPVLLALFDLILRPTMNLRRRTPKELILMAQEAQRVLLYVLEYFGPDPFESVWKNFKPMYFGQFKDRRINRPALELENDDDDDDEPYECSLTEFDDLWDLAAYCFGYVEPRHRNNKQQDQQSLKQPAGHMRRRMVLNVIITVLEADLRDRRGSNSALEKCEFLNTLRKDSTGNRSQFDRYLDIIFCAFGCHSSEDGEPTRLKDAEAAEFAGRLLNMMGVLSYCDNLVTTSALVEQTYRRFLKLDVESCANLIQIIESTTFLSALCDLYLSDSDCSCVPEEYMKLRKGRHTTFLVEKLLHFNIKTRPVKLESLEDIYRHVMIVLWRYMLYFNERSLRYDVSRTKQDGSRTFHSRTISTVTDDQKIEVIVSGPDAIAQWRKHVDSMIKEVGGDSLSGENDRKLKKQIKWSIQLLQLYM